MIAESLSALIDGIRLWKERTSVGESDEKAKHSAIQSVMEAVVATKAYLYDQRTGAEPNRDRETSLSQLWQKAAASIYAYDHELHAVAQLKALAWADPQEWKRAASQPLSIRLDTIVEQCEWLKKRR